ncbi:MBL fold metallo-hydrolase [Flavitalea flava]
MERRALLIDIFLLGLGASLPYKKLLANAPLRDLEYKNDGPAAFERPFHHFTLGDLEMTVVTDGSIRESPVQPDFAPGIPSASVDSLLAESFRSTREINLAVNILVIRKDKRTILVDTGCGTGFGMDFGSSCGWLPGSLTAAGIQPEQVTDIIITHAHPDHIGGLFHRDGSPVFPQAQVYISAIEHQFWLSENPDFSKSQLNHTDLLKLVLSSTHKTLLALKPNLHFFEDQAELFGCIRLQKAAGHTPGHTLVHVYSGGDELVHIADLLHSDVLQFPHPEWGYAGDTDMTLAASTRAQVLSVLSENKTKVFAYHLPWPGIGHVRKKGAGREWVAEVYPVPG